MRHLFMRLAVALCTVTGLFSCAVEHEEDGVNDLGVDLGDCDCAVKAVLWINSNEGGTITCQGQTWPYTQGVRIFPICLDNSNAGFTVGVEAAGETWAEARVISEGPDDMPAYFDWEWTGDTPRPNDWPPEPPAGGDMNDLTGVYLPWRGSFNAVVPGWIHSPYDD